MILGRKTAGITISLGLGIVLMSFQNCSPGMGASQTFQNANLSVDRQTPETDSQFMFDDILKAEAARPPGTPPPVCYPSDLKLNWPLPGVPFKDWVTVNYVDGDSASGTYKDYVGNTGTSAVKAFTYDGHRGMDIDVPSFRFMDLDFPVYAAANGVVEGIYDDSPDRNLSCASAQWNYVKIKHSTGIRTVYGHLKRDSIAVNVGSPVVAGQRLGVVGSSGCSTYPHLHFEVDDCKAVVLDPMKLGMFNGAPVYTMQAPATIMDTILKQPVITSINGMIDPGPSEPPSVRANMQFSLGFTVAILKQGNVLRVDLYKPDGSLYNLPLSLTSPNRFSLSHWYWNFQLPEPGLWTAKYFLNGVQKGERQIQVTP